MKSNFLSGWGWKLAMGGEGSAGDIMLWLNIIFNLQSRSSRMKVQCASNILISSIGASISFYLIRPSPLSIPPCPSLLSAGAVLSSLNSSWAEIFGSVHCKFCRSSAIWCWVRPGSCDCGWRLEAAREDAINRLRSISWSWSCDAPCCEAIAAFNIDWFGRPWTFLWSCIALDGWAPAPKLSRSEYSWRSKSRLGGVLPRTDNDWIDDNEGWEDDSKECWPNRWCRERSWSCCCR